MLKVRNFSIPNVLVSAIRKIISVSKKNVIFKGVYFRENKVIDLKNMTYLPKS